MPQGYNQPPEPPYGWVMVVVAAIFMGMGAGSLVSISVFLKPMATEFGWLRGQTAFAYLAGSIAVGVGGIVMGHLADRLPTRRIALSGAVFLGLAYLLLARQRALWQFYLLYCLMGGLGTAAFMAPMLANVGKWFERNRGLALGSATAGFGLVQSLLPYASRHLISTSGWSGAYTILGIFTLALLVPLTLFVRSPPTAGTAGSQAPAGGELPVYERGVVWISAAVVFCCICMATPMVHVVALAQDKGLQPQNAAGILTVLLITGLAGRIAFGKSADHIGGLPTYLLSSAGQTVLVFFFVSLDSVWGFYLFAALFGLIFSGVMTCIIICAQEFALAHRRGISLGIVGLFGWIGMGLGGWQGGFFFDLTGTYTVSYANAALAGVINLIILGMLTFRVKRFRQAEEVCCFIQ